MPNVPAEAMSSSASVISCAFPAHFVVFTVTIAPFVSEAVLASERIASSLQLPAYATARLPERMSFE